MKRLLMPLIASLLCLATVVSGQQQQDDLKDVERSARIYLEAVKTSDFNAVRPVASSYMVEWTGKFLPVIFDYKVVRGEPVCTESVEFSVLREPIVSFSQSSMLLHTLPAGTSPTKAVAGMQAARAIILPVAPCLVEMFRFGGDNMFTDRLLSQSGVLTSTLYRFIVDVETPGRGGVKMTERWNLRIARVSIGGIGDGWRVISFAAPWP